MPFSLRRLYWSLAASLGIHAAVLMSLAPGAVPLRASRIEVRLPQIAERALLKNTLDTAQEGLQRATAARTGESSVHALEQQRKFAAHVFYPPQAVVQGLQGEVRLLLRLDVGGRIVEARVVSSSGHDILDEAAVAAAYATGRLPAAGRAELILPVVFSLSE